MEDIVNFEIPVTDEEKKEAWSNIAMYVGGTWGKIDSNKMVIKRIRQVKNFVFKNSFPKQERSQLHVLHVSIICIDPICDSGGYTNKTYHCSLPNDVVTSSEERHLIVRKYGCKHFGHGYNRFDDSIVLTILSHKNLAPTIFGLWPTGHIEEYIPV